MPGGGRKCGPLVSLRCLLDCANVTVRHASFIRRRAPRGLTMQIGELTIAFRQMLDADGVVLGRIEVDGRLGLEVLGLGHVAGRHCCGRGKREFVVVGGGVRWLLRRIGRRCVWSWQAGGKVGQGTN